MNNKDREVAASATHSASPPEVEPGQGGQSVEREPDYRFTLANERTFLAWIRTSLALLAAGVAVQELFAGEHADPHLSLLATICVVVATGLSIGAYHRWRRVQAAMRRGEPLPATRLVSAAAAGICMIALVCVWVIA